MDDDRTLIDKVKTGDRRAFKKLYNQHYLKLYRFMRQYSHNTPLVEDWVQRAFIKSFEKISGFNGTSRFSTWLFTIALNEMRSDFRRADILDIRPEDSEYPVTTDNGDEYFEWNDLMKSWLTGLDDAKRSVFLLYEVEGYSHAEIASMLDINENLSRTLLCRAKQCLRRKWELMEKNV